MMDIAITLGCLILFILVIGILILDEYIIFPKGPKLIIIKNKKAVFIGLILTTISIAIILYVAFVDSGPLWRVSEILYSYLG